MWECKHYVVLGLYNFTCYVLQVRNFVRHMNWRRFENDVFYPHANYAREKQDTQYTYTRNIDARYRNHRYRAVHKQ
jgi:hypothetical protein